MTRYYGPRFLDSRIGWWHEPIADNLLGASPTSMGEGLSEITTSYGITKNTSDYRFRNWVPAHVGKDRQSTGTPGLSLLWPGGGDMNFFEEAPSYHFRRRSPDHRGNPSLWAKPSVRDCHWHYEHRDMEAISVIYPDNADGSSSASASVYSTHPAAWPSSSPHGYRACDMTDADRGVSFTSDRPVFGIRRLQHQYPPASCGVSMAVEGICVGSSGYLSGGHPLLTETQLISSPSIPALASVPPLDEGIQHTTPDRTSKSESPRSQREKILDQALRREKQEHDVTKLALKELALRGRDGTTIDLASFGIREDDKLRDQSRCMTPQAGLMDFEDDPACGSGWKGF